MKASSHPALLADVLGDGTADEFRSVALVKMLSEGRKRRQRKAVAQASAVCVGLVLSVVATTRFSWLTEWAGERALRSGAEQIHTKPFSPNGIVSTRTLDIREVVNTKENIVVVRTTPQSGRFRLLNDEELLALTVDRPAVLIRRGPHTQELVFVDSLP